MKDALKKKSTQQKFHIVNFIRARGTASRHEIGEEFGIALPTVSSLVRDLQEAGLVVAEGRRTSSGGRPPEVLAIASGFGTVIGAEVRHSRVSAALVDVRGHLVAEALGGEGIGLQADTALNTLEESISRLLEAQDVRRLLGIGVGVSGIVEEGNRVSRRFPGSAGWTDVPLADRLERRFGVRPLLLNDVCAAALGEARSAAWGERPSLIYLHVGDGIAAALVVEGRAHRGATGNAGEVGHAIVEPGGPLCYCGNRGCLESVASRVAVVARCREAIEHGVLSRVAEEAGGDLSRITFRHVLEAARDGDPLARSVLEQAGTHRGRAAANLVNLLNPSVLVLSGVSDPDDSPLVEPIRRAFNSMVMPPLRRATRIVFAHVRERAVVLGAAEAVLDEFFASPERLFAAGERGERSRPSEEAS